MWLPLASQRPLASTAWGEKKKWRESASKRIHRWRHGWSRQERSRSCSFLVWTSAREQRAAAENTTILVSIRSSWYCGAGEVAPFITNTICYSKDSDDHCVYRFWLVYEHNKNILLVVFKITKWLCWVCHKLVWLL